MVAPNPVLKSSKVIEEVNAILSEAAFFLPENDLRVKRLLREAQSSIQVNAAEGHSALACVYQLTGDSDKGLHHIDNAIELDAGNSILLGNKVTILMNLGYFLDAMRLFERAIEPERGQFTRLWHSGFVIGAFRAMNRQLERARVMALETGGMDATTAARAAKVLDSAGVSDETLGKVLDVAGEVLRSHRLFYVGKAPHIVVFDEPGHSAFVQMTYDVAVGAVEAHQLYLEYINNVTARIAEIPDVLSVRFMACKQARERNAA